MASSDEVQISEQLSEQAVEHYDILANAQVTNMKAARITLSALQQLRPLKDALTQMNQYSTDFPRLGTRWHQEKRIVYKSISYQHKLSALLEMPTLVVECIQHEMYHEALLVLDYVSTLLQYGEQASLLKRLHTLVYFTMQQSLGSTLLARLARPSNVDATYKIVLFLRRFGVARAVLVEVFLTQRSKYIQSLMSDTMHNPVVYSRILQLLVIYKTHIHDTVLQFDSCFTHMSECAQKIGEQHLLTSWCCEQIAALTGLLIETISEIKSCAELALVIEQIYVCSLSCAKINIDMTMFLDDIITSQVRRLFSMHVRNASSVYRSCMHNHTWRSNSIALNIEDDSRVMPSSSESTAHHGEVDGAEGLGEPPSVLRRWLPLAYAVNGLLTAFNSIRRSVLPGVEIHIALDVAEFIAMIASDIHNDAQLLTTMDDDEKNTYMAFMKSFTQFFYPYVLQCTTVLLGKNAHLFIRAKVDDHVNAIDSLCNR